MSTYIPWLGECGSGAAIDDGCWKQVWAELEGRLFTIFWPSLPTPNARAGRIAQLIEEAERRGQAGTTETARVKSGTPPVPKAV